MRLGLYLGYAPLGATELISLAEEAERLGFESAWAAEAWGTDAVTVLSFLAARTTTLKVGSAIMQIPGRTPANTAMTAMTLDLLSGGRFLLGLGVSGPQVVEGWHPVYLAALGSKSIELAADIADGWLPLYLSPERFDELFRPHLKGAREGLEIAAGVQVVPSDDLEACRDVVKQVLALYIGGMGARKSNFYNDAVRRYGYESEAAEVQELYLAGRLAAWRECGVTTLLCQTRDVGAMRLLGELAA